jgi:hypothetical protein
MLYCHGCVTRMPPEARCTALPLRRQESPGRQSRRDLDFNHHITVKSASSAPLLIAVQGIEWLLARNLRLPSHGLARPQHTGCGSRHSFNFHNTTIPPRSTPGPRHCGSAGGGGSRWRVAVRRFTLSGIGHTWARASTSTSTSAPRARALNGERKLYAAWERGRVDGSENHCALRNITAHPIRRSET